MSAIAAEAPSSGVDRPDAERGLPRLFEPAEVTLEDVILDAWEDLAASGRAECPVCRERIEPAGCRSCGSELG